MYIYIYIHICTHNFSTSQGGSALRSPLVPPLTFRRWRTVAGGARRGVSLEDGPELRQRAAVLRQQRGVEVDGLLGATGRWAEEIRVRLIT